MFVVYESIMNGTVITNISVFGINVNDFNIAKEYMKKTISNLPKPYTINEDNDKVFKYTLNSLINTGNTVYGMLENKPLMMLDKDGNITIEIK
jgi:hypothetical protein